uniref:hypothetical protein n=1 Tax=Acinetobacter baumannii TaxID=470 RepID=UPI001C073DD5
WNVLFGASKCKTIVISKLQDSSGNYPPLQFFNTALCQVDEIELLGITIRSDLTWNHLVNNMAQTAGRKLGLLRKVSFYLTTTSHNLQSQDQVKNGVCLHSLDGVITNITVKIGCNSEKSN